MKKILKWVGIVLVTLILIALIFISVTFPPVMTGYASKVLCSCVFLGDRTLESVVSQEMQIFPGMDKARFTVNYQDSTATVSLLWTERKAIYRRGLGCTSIAEMSEEQLRRQKIATTDQVPAAQETMPWPSGNFIAGNSLSPAKRDAINQVVDQAFYELDPKKPVRTHAVVVVHRDNLIAEKYAEGFTMDSRQMGWSMTKSITNALIGIAVGDGKLSIEEQAPIAGWQDDERKAITIQNLLQATSGLQWSESYYNPLSEFHSMFTHSDDKAGYAATMSLENEPGAVFEYSSGSTNLLQKILRDRLGDSAYYKFPYERLFYKIGMNRTVIEPDASGTFVGSSYCYASARDWARFGQLYLNDGVWSGERILPEGWVQYSTTPSAAAKYGEYGAQIWLNRGAPGDPASGRYKGLPMDAIIFDGHEENSVVVVPSRSLVIVRLGVTHHGNFDLASLVNGVIRNLPDVPLAGH